MNQLTARLFCLLAFFAVPAVGGVISIVFGGPASGYPGDVVSVFASMGNATSDSINLVTDSFSISTPFDIANFDDSAFLYNWPLSLDGGSSFGPAALFDVTIPLNAPAGVYTETYNVFGGANASDQTMIASSQFEIDVLAVSAPEPYTVFLTAFGIALLAFKAHSARKRVSQSAAIEKSLTAVDGRI